MEKEFDIVALGELLIDFTEAGTSKQGMRLFEQNPGGAPANLLTTASHMGYKTAFIGKVGCDMHGVFLKEVLQKEKICTDYIVEDKNYFTTLAFVAINEKGEREFSFARKPGADTRLQIKDLKPELMRQCRIFHFGSLSLTDEPVCLTTLEAINLAREGGAMISYDPNYRESLWNDKKAAIDKMNSVIKYADVMKVSDEESVLLTGENDYQKAVNKLLDMGPQLVAVTLGEDGVFVSTKELSGFVAARAVEAIDTTGAGDSFWGGFLSQYLSYKKDITQLSWEEIEKCALYGNITAGLCVQKRGGIPAIPQKSEVEQKIQSLN